MKLEQYTYADVILPLPLANLYTYSIPEGTPLLTQGVRVAVAVKSKVYTGLIYSLHNQKPRAYETKPILAVLDEKPLVSPIQLKFWEWISNYYHAFFGDVYRCALPSGLKIESETTLSLKTPGSPTPASIMDNSHFSAPPPLEGRENNSLLLNNTAGEGGAAGTAELTPKQWRIINALHDTKKPLTTGDLTRLIGAKDILKEIKILMEKGLVEISENIYQRYKAKTETYLRNLAPAEAIGNSHFSALLPFEGRGNNPLPFHNKTGEGGALVLSKKQSELLLYFIDNYGNNEVNKKDFLNHSNFTASVLKGLVDKGIIVSYEKEVSRLDFPETNRRKMYPLNSFQQKAYGEIQDFFSAKKTVLLHGVTASGKTEIYIHLIQEALNAKKQVLFLVPEIALTTQLTNRLHRVFGNKLGVYHSKFSDAERVEIWNNLLQNNGYEIIIGVRSSIFLPFSNLGLIIVDEEHENSYKQFDSAPRYHARNAAVMLAHLHGANTLLGTATPAIETYNNAIAGKYGLVELLQRHEEIALPQIITVDVGDLRKRKIMKGFFSPILLEKMQEALGKGEQIILFQNRRGYAPFLECSRCFDVPKCKNCDVTLTVHKAFNALTCHYCGYTKPVPLHCPSCGEETLETKGFGTEKIEEEIQALFPNAIVGRMDLDTTRTKKSYERIIQDFEQKRIDILVGTQMISKGLDFEHVSLVGILNADNLLNFPDFRAHERAFQLMLQVSGRAGRKNKQGMVIIQTTDPNNPIIQQVKENDYKAMFFAQMSERELFKYPPYYRLIYIVVRHRDLQILNSAAKILANELRKVFGARVLGPDNPIISRIQNLFIKRIVLKIEVNTPNEYAKNLIQNITEKILSIDRFKSLLIHWDVDPM